MRKRTLSKIKLISLCFVSLLLLRGYYNANAQEITRDIAPSISGTVCPGTAVDYNVSIPSGFSNCSRSWSVTNGTISGSSTGTTLKVFWNDTPGATATVSCTFSGCPNSSNNKTVSLNQLILSVKNQSWGTYGNVINIDYCTPAQVNVIVPKMYVQGTGGINQPPLQEVFYAWTLPAGWQTLSGATGAVNSSSNAMVIVPTKCAVPGMVKVEGVIIDRCGATGLSSAAVISLNGASPVLTVGPQPGYTGSTACNTSPVTFYATTQVALGCISSYSWNYPSSWSLVSQSANTITLTPSGTAADSNPIRATINLSCGSSITSGNYVPSFLTPTLTGPSYVCTDGGTFTLSNIPPGTPVTWSVSPGYLASPGSGTGTSAVIYPADNESGGAGVITFNVPCANVSASRETWIGAPDVWSLYFIDNINPNNPGPTNNTGPVCIYDGSASVAVSPFFPPSQFLTQHEWGIEGCASCICDFCGVQDVNIGYMSSFGFQDNYAIKYRAENVCGWSGWRYFGVAYCDEGPYTVSPNPATEYVSIDYAGSEKFSGTKHEYEIHIFDQSGNKVEEVTTSEKSVKIPVRKLVKGSYILHIRDKDRIYRSKIIVEK